MTTTTLPFLRDSLVDFIYIITVIGIRYNDLTAAEEKLSSADFLSSTSVFRYLNRNTLQSTDWYGKSYTPARGQY